MNVTEEWGKWEKWGRPERPAGFWWGVEKRERGSTEEGEMKIVDSREYGVWVGFEPLRDRKQAEEDSGSGMEEGEKQMK